jgi:23S rRNA (cytosine1962-C5)-methyltransferase
MDLDEAAVATARDNARRNGLAVRDLGDHGVVFEHGDVFDALRAYAAGPVDARPEVLVIDPPKWARDRQGLGAAIARYRDLNRLALQAVRPGGIVCTNSCSGLVQTGMFLAVTGAAPDHPVNPIYPEGRYLKCAFLSAGGEGSGPGHTRREESR